MEQNNVKQFQKNNLWNENLRHYLEAILLLLKLLNFFRLQFSKFLFLSLRFTFQLNLQWAVANSNQIPTNQLKSSQFLNSEFYPTMVLTWLFFKAISEIAKMHLCFAVKINSSTFMCTFLPCSCLPLFLHQPGWSHALMYSHKLKSVIKWAQHIKQQLSTHTKMGFQSTQSGLYTYSIVLYKGFYVFQHKSEA